MKNIFEKKEKMRKVVNNILFSLFFIAISVAIWCMYYFLRPEIGVLDPFSVFVTAIYLLGQACFIYLACEFLGIKFPKNKKNEIEIEALEELFSEKRSIFYSEESRKIKKENKYCPSCGNKEGNIKKIRNTSGKISGDFSLGFGSVSGQVQTCEVNHCSHCGNEWKIAEVSDYYKSEAYEEIIDQVYNFFEKGRDNTSDPLKEFSAIALHKFFKKNKEYPFYSNKGVRLSKLSVREIKKYTGK